MRAYQEQLLIPDHDVFLIKKQSVTHFTTPRHYHRELEIKFMLDGGGKGFIGDTIYEYSKNDLVLLGPNLPHHWESSSHHKEKGVLASCYYVQFKEECLGNEFLEKKDHLSIAQLFQNARSGIRFFGNTSIIIRNFLEKLWHAKGIQRTLWFIEILSFLAESNEYTLLTNSGFVTNASENDKLNKVYRYIISNFKHEISLEKASKIAMMGKSSFCIFFKKRTQKSFSDFVNEVRLNHAVNLMIEKEKGIAEACYESGFNNISYFNRKFLEIYKMNPREYLKRF